MHTSFGMGITLCMFLDCEGGKPHTQRGQIFEPWSRTREATAWPTVHQCWPMLGVSLNCRTGWALRKVMLRRTLGTSTHRHTHKLTSSCHWRNQACRPALWRRRRGPASPSQRCNSFRGHYGNTNQSNADWRPQRRCCSDGYLVLKVMLHWLPRLVCRLSRDRNYRGDVYFQGVDRD